MKNREIDFRIDSNVLREFSEGRSRYQIVDIATITIFYKSRLIVAGVSDDVLVCRENIMQIQLRHDAEGKQQQQRASSEVSYDPVILQTGKFVTRLQINENVRNNFKYLFTGTCAVLFRGPALFALQKISPVIIRI